MRLVGAKPAAVKAGSLVSSRGKAGLAVDRRDRPWALYENDERDVVKRLSATRLGRLRLSDGIMRYSA
jgi:hypothetical protein